jgi:MFS transporter, PAT family, beta-lactamase induction signal transducer AmpG
LFMLPGIGMTLLISEPVIASGAPRTLRAAVIEPFVEFIGRTGWRHAVLVLAFIFLYKLGDSMATALATAFYLDMGFSKSQIGLIAKNAGLWASVFGGLLGGLWMVKLGINRALWIFGAAQGLSILGFALLSQLPGDRVALAGAIGFEALGVGLGTAAFAAFIARTTNPRYTATQFALFTSLAAVPRTLINATTGWIVEQTGWLHFYLLCTLLAVPGMVLLWWVAPWAEKNRDS